MQPTSMRASPKSGFHDQVVILGATPREIA